MKKELVVLAFVFVFMFNIGFVSSVSCTLDVSLINQDPYPATPGDYVKVVFQIEGIQNPECETVNFEIKDNYPFSADPSTPNKVQVQSGTYSRTYSSFYLATYKLRVDEDALEGDNPIETVYSSTNGAELLKEFNIYVEDTRADFEVHVKDYNPSTKILTFEILNTEDVDVEALTIEIPKQNGIEVKGANRKVVGDLDSNEYTTANFEVIPKEKQTEMNITIIYTDSINARRKISEQVLFDSTYFDGRNGDKKGLPWFWIILVLAIGGYFLWRRNKKNQLKSKIRHPQEDSYKPKKGKH